MYPPPPTELTKSSCRLQNVERALPYATPPNLLALLFGIVLFLSPNPFNRPPQAALPEEMVDFGLGSSSSSKGSRSGFGEIEVQWGKSK